MQENYCTTKPLQVLSNVSESRSHGMPEGITQSPPLGKILKDTRDFKVKSLTYFKLLLW